MCGLLKKKKKNPSFRFFQISKLRKLRVFIPVLRSVKNRNWEFPATTLPFFVFFFQKSAHSDRILRFTRYANW